jgi:hypothetical protein
MKVIVRDDDVSYFTPPEFLEQLYASLWAKGLPVCLSVIPNHYDSVFVAYRSTIPEPDENTPPSSFGKGMTHSVWKNSRLASFLSGLAKSGAVELCVHGLEHRYREFDVDADRAREYLVSSVGILAATFPLVKPTTFVPPYEALSRSALKSLADHRFDVATCLDTARSLNLVGARNSHQDGVFEGERDSVVFGCASYLFDPLCTDDAVKQALQETLRRKPDLLIVANHYWGFFDRFIAPKMRRIQLWVDFVGALIARDAVFTTFREEAIRFRHSCP